MRVVRPAVEQLSDVDAQELRDALVSGALLIYPTDTLYALGGLVTSAAAAERVRAGKSRDEAKALPAVAADLEQVRRLCPRISESAWALAQAFWPGPLTLVLAAASDISEAITAGTGTIAVRVPSRALTRTLCRLAGPLISTSANVAGQPPASTCAEALAAVGPAAALAVEGGPGATLASTIVDATGSAPRLIRAGAVEWDAVIRIWS